MHPKIKKLLSPAECYGYLLYRWRKSRGFAYPPKTINIMPTFACNMKCRVCTQDQLLEQDAPMYRAMLKIEHLVKLLDEVGPTRPAIMLIGGEPFLHPEIRQIIEEIKKRDLYLAIFTNGFRLTRDAQYLLEAGVNLVMVSLDGRRELNDESRGKGSYDRAVEGIKAFRDARGLTNPDAEVKIVSTISDLTHPHLSQAAELALELQVDGFALSHLQYQNEKEMRAQVQAAKKYLSDCFDPDELDEQMASFANFKERIFGPVDPEVLIGQIDRIRDILKGHIPFGVLPALSDVEIRKYYTEGERYRRPKSDKCISIFESVSLSSTGGISLCMGYNCGHIQSDKFFDIWNSDRTRTFRKAFLKNGRFPVCQRCCN